MSSELSYLVMLINMIKAEGEENNRKRLWSLIKMLAEKEIGMLTEKEAVVVLREMHELNLEQHVRIQANHFYEDFPFTKIKSQLVADFIEMEHCKRRDDFEGFSMAAFQQIENITNYLFLETNIWELAKANKDIPMYTSVNKENIKKRFGLTLGVQMIFAKVEDRSKAVNEFFSRQKDRVDFVSRYKLILYFGYFDELVKTFDEWNQLFNLGYDLYLSRNANHRGAVSTDAQTAKQENLIKHKYRYYLLFLGFLADFIQKISSNYKTDGVVDGAIADTAGIT